MPHTHYPLDPVLLVDDEEAWLNSLSLTLRSNGITHVRCCSDSRQLLDILAEQSFAAIVLDLIMPHQTGEELLPHIVRAFPDTPVIILTGMDQVEIAVQCMKLGAFDYQTKVAEENRLINAVRRAIEFGQIKRENALLKNHFLQDTLDQPQVFSKIITRNKKMRALFQYMEAIAPSTEPVLITGETGTGKELVAEAIHRLSGRLGLFVPVNIAGLDCSIFADTLFGHQKGAFTGASEPRSGLIAKAANGSLFLDEIGDLDATSQTKLLRLLQEREYLPLGADLAKKTNARMIFATHHTIEHLLNGDSFRPDLFYRLRSHHINLPPLRERVDDLPLLLDFFLKEAAAQQNKVPPSYPPELPTLLSTYHFPGNIRELRSMIYDALSKHRSGTLSLSGFQAFITESRNGQAEAPHSTEALQPYARIPQLPTLKEAGNMLILEALRRTNGNQSMAAEMLGITRQALGWRLKKDKERA